MKSKTPTQNQLRVWNALDAIATTSRRAPTIRELQYHLDGMSTSTIQRLLIDGVSAGRVATWERDGKATSYVPVWFQQIIDAACSRRLDPGDPTKFKVIWDGHPAFAVGRMAHETGVPREDCPYPKNAMPAANVAWHAGWDDADEEARLAE